jgi:ppGpp synthetase/RelA/SpoT-type nucleotidyltranferase
VQLFACQELEAEVGKIRPLLDQRWHYEYRLKSPESFALKVEAGLFRKGLVIEDFFACTIVVRNNAEIAKAVALVQKEFKYLYRRPRDDLQTSVSPTDFRFDDLRLYFRLRPPNYLPGGPVHKIIFEVQIKTFLQHAWAVATHDLTYKSDSVSWAKMRIAHQIRAMLEHAELSIEQVETLGASTLVAKEFADYVELTQIINTIRKYWPNERLPRDLLRLARNTREAIHTFGINLQDLDQGLDRETQAGRGANLENLSPYGSIMQTILNGFTTQVSNAKIPERKITISSAVELPLALPKLDQRIFRVV